jgi:hypothetical protein
MICGESGQQNLTLTDLKIEDQQATKTFRDWLDKVRAGVEEELDEHNKIVVRWHECDFMGLCRVDFCYGSVDAKHSDLISTILNRWDNIVGAATRYSDDLALRLGVDKTLVWRSFFDDETNDE